MPSSFLVFIFYPFFVFLSCVVCLLLFHAKKNINILHLKGYSGQCFGGFLGFLFLFSLSNALLLSLLSPLAPPHLNLPLFGVCVCVCCFGFLVVFSFLCWFCVCCFCFVFGLHGMSEKGRVTPLSPLRPGVENICFRSGCFGAQNLECVKEDVFKSIEKPLFLRCFLLESHFMFLGHV